MLYMWCNSLGDTNGNPKLGFNAARSILCGATTSSERRSPLRMFQCRTQHFMCATLRRNSKCLVSIVSMPHAAFYVVQRQDPKFEVNIIQFQCRTQHFMWCNSKKSVSVSQYDNSFNAARSIICGATTIGRYLYLPIRFQCRTQHFMWCNERGGARFAELLVSMPHAALYVVQQ